MYHSLWNLYERASFFVKSGYKRENNGLDIGVKYLQAKLCFVPLPPGEKYVVPEIQIQ